MSRRASLGTVVAFCLGLFAACGGDPHNGVDLDQTQSSLLPSDHSIPVIDFNEKEPSGAISLTFDDGPDASGHTGAVLDILAAKGVAATFFINTKNYVDVVNSPAAMNLIQRMLNEGHDVGNHTVHHYDLGNTSTDVVGELQGVDDFLSKYFPAAFNVRLARAPFGNPYYGPQSRLDYVAPIMANYGVHIGWQIDSKDASGCTSGTCVYNNVMNAVNAGKSGIVLMHATNAYTPAVLGSIIDDLRGKGKYFVKVEELVIAKYGQPSRDLYRGSGGSPPPTPPPCDPGTCPTSTDPCKVPICTSTGVCGFTTTNCDDGNDCTEDACKSGGGCTHTVIAGCGVDAGPADTGTMPMDTGVMDTGPKDTGVTDSGTTTKDTGVGVIPVVTDSGPKDTGPADTGTAVLDTAVPDTTPPDTAGPDTARPDTAPVDTGTAAVDSAVADTGPEDTGTLVDSEVVDSEADDTGAEEDTQTVDEPHRPVILSGPTKYVPPANDDDASTNEESDASTPQSNANTTDSSGGASCSHQHSRSKGSTGVMAALVVAALCVATRRRRR